MILIIATANTIIVSILSTDFLFLRLMHTFLHIPRIVIMLIGNLLVLWVKFLLWKLHLFLLKLAFIVSSYAIQKQTFLIDKSDHIIYKKLSQWSFQISLFKLLDAFPGDERIHHHKAHKYDTILKSKDHIVLVVIVEVINQRSYVDSSVHCQRIGYHEHPEKPFHCEK